MKKLKKFGLIFTIIMLISSIIFTPLSVSSKLLSKSSVQSGGVPEYLNIAVQGESTGIIQYEDFYLNAREIMSRVGIGYCLEIDKNYPSGQTFEVEGRPSEEIVRILAAGYPNKSAAELGLKSDEDAYFATQIVIWSIIEGYDVYKFISEDELVLNAIKNIYAVAKSTEYLTTSHTVIEYSVSSDVQRVVIYMKEII